MNAFGRRYYTFLRDALTLWSPKSQILVRSSCINQRIDEVLLPIAAQERHQHTISNPGGTDGLSTWQKLKWDMGFHGKLAVPKRHLRISGFNLYICCTDFIDFNEFVKEARVPDTFNAWFLLLQLHMWLVLVKLNQMGREGMLLTQFAYQCMWSDVERRLNTFQELMASEKRNAMKDFHSIMCSSILYYDEGLLSSDQVLANSIWIQLYGMDPQVTAQELELMVEYVRKQIFHLDQMDPQPVMKPGFVSFLPLVGDKLDQAKANRHQQSLLKA